MKFQTLILAAAMLIFTVARAVEPTPTRPNIVLIVADDLGYADLGCYGGEIDTPSIDSLARDGLRFSQFRVEPMCVVSRVALMAGMPFNHADNGKYTKAVPFPRLLHDAGYATAMIGKWHAGDVDPRDPKLFDRFYGFLGGMTDCFVGGPDWFDGDKPVSHFPAGFYSTHAFGQHAVDFINHSADAHKPFFLCLSFNSPHHPCQAPRHTVEKYAHTYDAGYDAVRNGRRKRQIEMGLVDSNWVDAPIDATSRRWSDLSEHRKRVESDRMAAYAAAVDEVDQQVGAVCRALADRKLDQNTLVIFCSDNGADYNNGALRTDEKQLPWRAQSNVTSGNEWAWVKNTPFRSFKHSAFEGGLSSPLVIRWPGRITREPNSIVPDAAHITDMYPTFLALADAEYPKTLNGKSLLPLTGESLLPLLAKGGTRVAKPVFSWYDFSASWHDGEWKIARLYDGPWQLFNTRTDRSESNDLAVDQPDRVASMARAFADFSAGTSAANPALPALQLGWGWHRLGMITNGHVKSITPVNGQIIDTLAPTIAITFDKPLALSTEPARRVRLYRVSDEQTPVWQGTPTNLTLIDDNRTLRFCNVPKLEPDTSYFIEWTPGFATVDNNPLGPLNDGAYWWRFRTSPTAH